jgi:hypothetical protein
MIIAPLVVLDMPRVSKALVLLRRYTVWPWVRFRQRLRSSQRVDESGGSAVTERGCDAASGHIFGSVQSSASRSPPTLRRLPRSSPGIAHRHRCPPQTAQHALRVGSVPIVGPGRRPLPGTRRPNSVTSFGDDLLTSRVSPVSKSSSRPIVSKSSAKHPTTCSPVRLVSIFLSLRGF